MNYMESSSPDQATNASPQTVSVSLGQLLRAGLQLAFFRPVQLPWRTHLSATTVWLLCGIYTLCLVFLARWLVAGPAEIYSHGLMVNAFQWATLAMMLWWAFDDSISASNSRIHRVGWALALHWGCSLVILPFAYAWPIAAQHLPVYKILGSWSGYISWALYGLITLWLLVVALRICHLLGMRVRRAALLVLVSTGLTIALSLNYSTTIWYASADDTKEDQAPRLRLTQAQFELQSRLLDQQLQQLAEQREGQHDVYAILYAPYAPEDVFLKEVRMIEGVLSERFAASGRVISLVNNAQTTATHAWATQENLKRSIEAAAQRMKSEEDVLLVYLTSHGARDFKLASSHWPLETSALTAQQLAAMLQAANIKHRIIAVSACYSGGWIAPLQTDESLVMTAADATHTSYGCGMRSELTYFGRAMFNEALRVTHSFEQAFAQAVPVIKKREEEAGKEDGFSNPQIFIGSQIKPLLSNLEKQLAAP
jgi:Peptidase C13 family